MELNFNSIPNEPPKNQPSLKTFNVGYTINRIDTRENVEVETKKDEWINWGNINNDYPQFLLKLKAGSPVFSVCVDSKTNMTIGDGVEIEGLGNVLVNKYETLSELYYKLVYDYWIFGGWAVETIPTRDGSGIESIYHVPYQNIRVGKDMDDDKHEREIDWFYYSEQWGERYYQKRKVVKFHGLDLTRREGRQLFYWKNYVPSTNKHYPETPYQSGVDAIVLEAEVMAFHKKNIAGSLMPNLFVSLIGDPTPTERQAIYEELIASYQGKDGQKLMLAFSNNAEERPVIEPINNNGNDTFYTEVLQMAVQSILTANQISSPLLLGIQTFGSNPFSQNAQELVVAQKHMLEYVIKPATKKINMALEGILALKYNRPIKLINNFATPNFE